MSEVCSSSKEVAEDVNKEVFCAGGGEAGVDFHHKPATIMIEATASLCWESNLVSRRHSLLVNRESFAMFRLARTNISTFKWVIFKVWHSYTTHLLNVGKESYKIVWSKVRFHGEWDYPWAKLWKLPEKGSKMEHWVRKMFPKRSFCFCRGEFILGNSAYFWLRQSRLEPFWYLDKQKFTTSDSNVYLNDSNILILILNVSGDFIN